MHHLRRGLGIGSVSRVTTGYFSPFKLQVLKCTQRSCSVYSRGQAKPASLLAGDDKFLAQYQLQIRIRSPLKGLNPVKSYFLGTFLGTAKIFQYIYYIYIYRYHKTIWPSLEPREPS